jgi:hypothetical protein
MNDEITAYFQPFHQRIGLILVSGIAVFWLIENAFPLLT